MTDPAVPPGALRPQKNSAGCGAALLWIFVAAWYGFLAMGSSVILSRLDGFGPLSVVLALALVGLPIVLVAVRSTAEALRFRGIELELHSTPGVLGGGISGVLRAPRRVLDYGPLNVRAAWYRRVPGRGAVDRVEWEGVEPLPEPMLDDADPVALRFSIRLPFDGEPSSAANYWNIELRSRLKGSVTFEIPVERTAMSSEAQTMAALRPSVTSAPVDAQTTIEKDLDGLKVALPIPSWLWKWCAIVIVVAVGGTIGANIVLPQFRAAGMPVSVSIDVYLGIAAVVFFLIGFVWLSLALEVSRIRVDPNGVEISYAFATRGRTHIPRADVRDVTATYAQASLSYQVNLIGSDGTAMAGGSLILVKSKDEADWIATELRRALFPAQPAALPTA